MAKSKIQEALAKKKDEEKDEDDGKSKISKALAKTQDVKGKDGKKEGTADEELAESGKEELKEETQGGPGGKTPDQMIEENLIVLMNLDEKKHDAAAAVTAIAHLAVTVLILKKAIDVLAAKSQIHDQAMGTLVGAHQQLGQQTAQVLQGMHQRLEKHAQALGAQRPIPPTNPAPPAQQIPTENL
jgi:hypothetical protein